MAYKRQNPYAALNAVPVDLSAGDWISASAEILTTNPTAASRLYLGGGGDLVVALAGALTAPVTFKAHAAGYTQDMGVVKVFQNGTTATNIVALF